MDVLTCTMVLTDAFCFICNKFSISTHREISATALPLHMARYPISRQLPFETVQSYILFIVPLVAVTWVNKQHMDGSVIHMRGFWIGVLKATTMAGEKMPSCYVTIHFIQMSNA